ncbi:MAG: DUF1194 domain-containing protein [Minwuiales bacterium]|nr:DUF1194 domain-containing protein [Minwuiales bacterium]
MRALRAWALTVLIAVGLTRPALAEPVDLQLILAVDSSSSVSYEEFALQMGGFATAFRYDGVIEAIGAGDIGAVAVTMVQWSTPGDHMVVLPWTVLRSAGDSHAFADAIDRTPRHIQSGGTGISAMITYVSGLFDGNGLESRRMVIDISGDGRDSHGPDIRLARDAAVARGITINGLPILSDEPDLERYFVADVIGGPGAFATPAADYSDFADAIRAKLIREIRGHPLVGGLTPPAAGKG